MKPLLKTEYVNLPLSIQKPWEEFISGIALVLGTSRNAALCLAIKFGAPILSVYVQKMRSELKKHCDAIDPGGKHPDLIGCGPFALPDGPVLVRFGNGHSENLGADVPRLLRGKNGAHDRRKHRSPLP